MAGDYYSDAEVDEMTEGLTQDAAKIRFLRRLGLRVDRKPNGRPLAWKPAPEAGAHTGAAQGPSQGAGDVVVALQGWAQKKRGNGGQKAQGR